MTDSGDLELDLTRLMARFGEGDPAAADVLLPRIYTELRAIAAAHFTRRPAGAHTLHATALVNEAYIKLVESGDLHVRDRKHFFVLVAKVMRQILVDHARARNARKRGGGRERLTLAAVPGISAPSIDLLALEEALTRLSAISPDRAQLVELRFFGGLQESEAAEALGISRAEASRRWRAARAWLLLQLRRGEDHDT